jgi:hypothetical protein
MLPQSYFLQKSSQPERLQHRGGTNAESGSRLRGSRYSPARWQRQKKLTHSTRNVLPYPISSKTAQHMPITYKIPPKHNMLPIPKRTLKMIGTGIVSLEPHLIEIAIYRTYPVDPVCSILVSTLLAALQAPQHYIFMMQESNHVPWVSRPAKTCACIHLASVNQDLPGTSQCSSLPSKLTE